MLLIVLAHLLDLATFALAANRLGIEGEGKPLARYAYHHAGLLGVIGLKVGGIAFVVWVIAGVTDSPGRSVAVGIIAALGVLGAATNLYALSR